MGWCQAGRDVVSLTYSGQRAFELVGPVDHKKMWTVPKPDTPFVVATMFYIDPWLEQAVEVRSDGVSASARFRRHGLRWRTMRLFNRLRGRREFRVMRTPPSSHRTN